MFWRKYIINTFLLINRCNHVLLPITYVSASANFVDLAIWAGPDVLLYLFLIYGGEFSSSECYSLLIICIILHW